MSTLDKVKVGDTVYVLNDGKYCRTLEVRRITPTMVIAKQLYFPEERYNKKTGKHVGDKKFKWLFEKYKLSPTKP